jgi:hypothetical protein
MTAYTFIQLYSQHRESIEFKVFIKRFSVKVTCCEASLKENVLFTVEGRTKIQQRY